MKYLEVNNKNALRNILLSRFDGLRAIVDELHLKVEVNDFDISEKEAYVITVAAPHVFESFPVVAGDTELHQLGEAAHFIYKLKMKHDGSILKTFFEDESVFLLTKATYEEIGQKAANFEAYTGFYFGGIYAAEWVLKQSHVIEQTETGIQVIVSDPATGTILVNWFFSASQTPKQFLAEHRAFVTQLRAQIPAELL